MKNYYKIILIVLDCFCIQLPYKLLYHEIITLVNLDNLMIF